MDCPVCGKQLTRLMTLGESTRMLGLQTHLDLHAARAARALLGNLRAIRAGLSPDLALPVQSWLRDGPGQEFFEALDKIYPLGDTTSAGVDGEGTAHASR